MGVDVSGLKLGLWQQVRPQLLTTVLHFSYCAMAVRRNGHQSFKDQETCPVQAVQRGLLLNAMQGPAAQGNVNFSHDAVL
eukprot:73024-Amphidinium_carterae.2